MAFNPDLLYVLAIIQLGQDEKLFMATLHRMICKAKHQSWLTSFILSIFAAEGSYQSWHTLSLKRGKDAKLCWKNAYFTKCTIHRVAKMLVISIIKTLTYHVYKLCYFRQLTRHGEAEHGVTSKLSPWHWVPPPAGGGESQMRERCFSPWPQVVLHSDQELQRPQPPDTVNSRNCLKAITQLAARRGLWTECLMRWTMYSQPNKK